MNLLSVSGLTRAGRTAPLLADITFGIEEGEKVALIGRNGSGKSTLLGCIAGVIAPDAGTVVINKAAGVSYLPQNPAFSPEDSVRDHIFRSGSPSLAVIREYESVCGRIGEQSEVSRSLSERLDALTREMDERDLWNYESRVRSVLTRLGIANLDQPMKTLSGGMVKKVALAQVLVEDTKLILMDEPTNHLDVTTIAWLEDWLIATDRSILMVTHDRYFLDAVCTSIYELDNCRLTGYEGNFSRYLEKKAIAEEIARNTETRIESVLRTEREWLMRGPQARGTKAKARIDSIHRMMDRERPAAGADFSFSVNGRRLGGKILTVDSISKGYSGADGFKPVLSNFSCKFRKGEKIGVFGDNGSGKTTLLNLLTGELAPDSGSVSRGDNTVFGYYHQNPQFPDTAGTVLEYIKETANVITQADGRELTASQLLENFGFEGKVQHSPLSTLSGGERKRVYLVRILMSNPNFLVLDEPTNDFDIYTMGVLEAFLSGYGGCLLVVSHDRFFMDRVADTLFVLGEGGTVTGFTGSCSDYIALREAETAEREARASIPEARDAGAAKRVDPDTRDGQGGQSGPGTAGAKTQKPKKRSFREEREFGEIEEEIAALEDRKGVLEALLSGGETDHVKLREIAEEFETLTRTLDEKYRRWEYLAELG